MAKNSKENWLKESEVHAACEAIRNREESVTLKSVYEEVGRGSLTTIKNFIKTWQDQNSANGLSLENLQASMDDGESGIPQDIMDVGEKVIISFWNNAKNVADGEFNVERIALKEANKEICKKLEEAESFSAQQDEAIKELYTQIEKAQLDVEEKEAALQGAVDRHKTLELQVLELEIREELAISTQNDLKLELKMALDNVKIANRRADLLEGELNAMKV